MYFDVIIVGSGNAGQSVAVPLAKAGRSVALIDDRPLGGTCALRGCTPKKYFVANREALDSVKDLEGSGITGRPKAVWEQTMALKKRFTDPFPENIEGYLKSTGVQVFKGTARFTTTDSILVIPSTHPRKSAEAMTASETELTFGYLVLACGSDTRIPNIPGIELAIDSEDFLALPHPPASMITLGAGYIAFEFAHVAAVYGAKVTMIDHNELPLKMFDPQLVQSMIASSRDRGITLVLGRDPVKLEKVGSFIRVTDDSGARFEAEIVLNAAGRSPRTEELDCSTGKVELKNGGVVVNSWGRSVSNPKVFAAGDVVSGIPMLSPVATKQANTVAEVLLAGGTHILGITPFSSRVIPSSVFTHPPLSGVGLSEIKAKELYGDDLVINQGDTATWTSSVRIGQRHGGYKVIIRKSTGEILGAHLLGHGSSEVINLFALAMEAHIPVQVLQNIPWAYPTAVSDIAYMINL